VKKTYTGGQLDETRHFYYTDPARWQVIEERSVVPSVIPTANSSGACVTSTTFCSVIATRQATARWTSGCTGFRTQIGTSRNATAGVWCVGCARGWERESKLYRVRNRLYHERIGFWMQRDPIGLSAGTSLYPRDRSLYSFLASNPLRRLDPSGLSWIGAAFDVGCDFLTSPGFGCLCFVIELLDALSIGIGAVLLATLSVPPNFTKAILDIADCACDIAGMIASTFCYWDDCGPGLFSEAQIGGWLISFMGQGASCAWDLLVDLSGLGTFGQIMNTIGDVLMSGISNLGSIIMPGNDPGWVLCQQAFGNIFR
jgi:RHS repeat-associated protein